jgi:hypothetical protein
MAYILGRNRCENYDHRPSILDASRYHYPASAASVGIIGHSGASKCRATVVLRSSHHSLSLRRPSNFKVDRIILSRAPNLPRMTNYYDFPAIGEHDPQAPPRRLPPVPRTARPKTRPLPQIPWARALACKECSTFITSSNQILPPSAVNIK